MKNWPIKVAVLGEVWRRVAMGDDGAVYINPGGGMILDIRHYNDAFQISVGPWGEYPNIEEALQGLAGVVT